MNVFTVLLICSLSENKGLLSKTFKNRTDSNYWMVVDTLK